MAYSHGNCPENQLLFKTSKYFIEIFMPKCAIKKLKQGCFIRLVCYGIKQKGLNGKKTRIINCLTPPKKNHQSTGTFA